MSPEIEAIYKATAGKEDTPELHREIGLELNRFSKFLAYAHRERVVELEPTDANWRALTEHFQNKQSGEWEHRDVLYKRKGLVSLGSNKWDTPQSQSIVKFKNAEKDARAEMAKLFTLHLKNLAFIGLLDHYQPLYLKDGFDSRTRYQSPRPLMNSLAACA